jgi:hypothetical protein
MLGRFPLYVERLAGAGPRAQMVEVQTPAAIEAPVEEVAPEQAAEAKADRPAAEP